MKKIPFWRKYILELSAATGGILMMNAMLFANAYRETDTINPTTAGQFGDFVGGYIGTAFALLSVLLLYRTLRTQQQSAKQQFFESKYFELIKMHRDNVAEMRLHSTLGRHVFPLILRELCAVQAIVCTVASRRHLDLTQHQILHVSYCCVFYGVSQDLSKMLRTSLHEYCSDFIEEIKERLTNASTRAEVVATNDLPYTPFEGQQSLLGHYYRHLYQTIQYVDRHDQNIDHYEYVKTVRAQLSTHEQVLLLINSLCPLGSHWWSESLIIKYKMVKNIPQNFLDPDDFLNVEALFPPGYFEWQEISTKTQVAAPSER